MSWLDDSHGAPESSAFDLISAVNDLINAVRLQASTIRDDTTYDHELQKYSITELHLKLFSFNLTYYIHASSIEPNKIVSDLQEAAKAEDKSLPVSQKEFEELSIGGKNFVQETRECIEQVLNFAIAHIKVSAEIETRNQVQS